MTFHFSDLLNSDSSPTYAALAGVTGLPVEDAAAVIDHTAHTYSLDRQKVMAGKLAAYFSKALNVKENELEASLLKEWQRQNSPEAADGPPAVSQAAKDAVAAVNGMNGLGEPHPLDAERAKKISVDELGYVLLNGGIEAAAIQQSVRNSAKSIEVPECTAPNAPNCKPPSADRAK